MPALPLLLIDDRHGRWATARTAHLLQSTVTSTASAIWAEGAPDDPLLLVVAGAMGREYLRFADLAEAFTALGQPLGGRVLEILPVYPEDWALAMLSPAGAELLCQGCGVRQAAIDYPLAPSCAPCARVALLRRAATSSS